jgi:hypothetical protein
MFCEDIEVMGMSFMYEWIYQIGRYSEGCVNGKLRKASKLLMQIGVLCRTSFSTLGVFDSNARVCVRYLDRLSILLGMVFFSVSTVYTGYLCRSEVILRRGCFFCITIPVLILPSGA